MEGVGNFGDVVSGEITQYAVFHVANLAGIDKQHFAFTFFCCDLKPNTGGDLGVGKELAGQGNHTFHQVGIDDAFADFAFVVGLATHGAVGKQQCHFAVGRGGVNHVLQPSEVGVAFRRRAVCPTWIIGKGFAPPIADVEWWVCHDEIHLLSMCCGWVKLSALYLPKS